MFENKIYYNGSVDTQQQFGTASVLPSSVLYSLGTQLHVHWETRHERAETRLLGNLSRLPPLIPWISQVSSLEMNWHTSNDVWSSYGFKLAQNFVMLGSQWFTPQGSSLMENNNFQGKKVICFCPINHIWPLTESSSPLHYFFSAIPAAHLVLKKPFFPFFS